MQARFGRRFPRRAPPLWTPLPWHPLFLRNPQGGGALWLRGRSERRGRRRPLRLGGNGAAPRTPVRRPGRPAACIARVCWGPAGEGQASHFRRRRALRPPRLGASWRLGARACALRLDGDLGQGLHLARLASRRLHWRLAALAAGNRRSAPLQDLENTAGPRAGFAARSLAMGSLHRSPASPPALPTSFL